MFIACTLRSFEADVGETLRIYGIVNALAAAGEDVTLISNAIRQDAFHPAVKHVIIGSTLVNKRRLQALASLLPAKTAANQYPDFFRRLEVAIQKAGAGGRTVYFFDYLDNTIGYVLKSTGKIGDYVNDVHGIATIEFENNRRLDSNPFKKAWYWLKESLASRLDRKVFERGAGFLFGSGAMRDYFQHRYRIRGKCLVLPYLMDEKALRTIPDPDAVATLRHRYGLSAEHFVFMFVGTYKATAGVEDLLAAFERLQTGEDGLRLLLVGDGMTRRYCEELVKSFQSRQRITFIDPVPYGALPDYYALADVIVCPDRDNAFSHFVVHIKYLDALASGKLVINGRFKSVLELNGGRPLSLLFKPSDVGALHDTLKDAWKHHDQHRRTFGFAGDYVREHLSYAASVAALVELNTFLNPST